jgi:hypothetical protein
MNMKNILHKLGAVAFLSSSLLFTGCDPEFEDDRTFSAGSLDLTKYVAVGNSLTAGYQDNGLSLEGQLNSYPNILANQFSFVGGGSFTQPLFSLEQRNGTGYLRLTGFTSTGSPITTTVNTELAVRGLGADGKTPLLTKFTGAINNFGVPGIRVADINTQGYGLNNPVAFNPYFERLLPDGSFTTYLQKVSTSAPTFFSLWLGNNDVLGYATAGGFAGSITATSTFETNYTAMVNALSANNTEGIVATIPDVRAVPFFTTVGPTFKASLPAAVPAVVVLTKNTSTRKVVLKSDIKSASGGTVLFTLTSAPYLPLVGTPTGKYWRDLAKSQNPSNSNAALQQYLAAFQIDTTKMFGLSGENPFPSALVLDGDEQAEIATATTAFNTFIKSQAASKNLAVFDAFEFFNRIQTGFALNGVNYSPAFITGNLFSLDGVHPTQRGYAIIANEMIRAINTKYGSTIPTIDVTQFRAVQIP